MDIDDIRRGLQKPGKSKQGLAGALNRQPSAVTALLKGDRALKAAEIPMVAKYLELDVSTPNGVSIMGYVGSGAVIDPEHEQVPPEGFDVVYVPFPLPDEMIGFEVRGESMLPKYDPGDIIVVWKETKRPLHDFFGKTAIVRTHDGKRYLKTIRPGRSKNFVMLESFNANPIENVKIDWLGEIYATVPADQVGRVGT